MSSGRPLHRRTTSNTDHTPANPSSLRQSYTVPGAGPSSSSHGSGPEKIQTFSPCSVSEDRASTTVSRGTHMSPLLGPLRGYSRLTHIDETFVPPLAGPSGTHEAANESTSLLRDWRERVHEGPCNHGTFSPRPGTPSSSILDPICLDAGESPRGEPEIGSSTVPIIGPVLDHIVGGANWKQRWVKRMRSKKINNSHALAEEAGLQDSMTMYVSHLTPVWWPRIVLLYMLCIAVLRGRVPLGLTDTIYRYLSYYVPFLIWMRQYKSQYLKGDLIAAITMASFYLPMALSLADNLAHVPPINGLYAFVFNPIIYALLGSCPQMVVGPEAAGSLLVGTVVKQSIDRGHGGDDDAMMHAQICGVVTGMAGATVLAAGLTRLGFLDSVLSRPFLRGFISAVGLVIAVDQLIPELGLSELAEKTPGIGHGSSMAKLEFMFKNLDKAHTLTCAVAFISFAIIMVFR